MDTYSRGGVEKMTATSKFGQAILGIVVMLGILPAASAMEVNHVAWDQMLRNYVKDGLVDYRGFNHADDILILYLGMLGGVQSEQLPSRDARLAFWINAYNACVIKGVLDHYPIKSVKDVKGFFDGIRYQIAGESLTLNGIEAKARALGDWRIHFAVVCASLSCPILRSEAYTADRVDAQLTQQVQQFLSNTEKGLRLDPRQDTLWVSKIFKWYAADFVPNGALTAQSLLERLRPVLDPAIAQAIGQELVKDYELHVRFMDYDWSLNAQTTR